MGSLAADLAMALDPVQFSIAAGIPPDPWQAQVLRSVGRRLMLNCCRQSGKSTTVGTLALHTAIYEAPALILLLSPGERQSGELFRKVMDCYKHLDRPVPATSESALQLTLANGSRIIALPGNEATTRGYSGAKLLVVDEAARVQDSLYYGIRPMLAVSGGRLALLSTPWGKRGFFHQEWTEGDGWERYEVPASECPRIPAEFLEEERRTLAPFWYSQEYDCKFSETTDQMFNYDDVQASLSADVVPLFA